MLGSVRNLMIIPSDTANVGCVSVGIDNRLQVHGFSRNFASSVSLAAVVIWWVD